MNIETITGTFVLTTEIEQNVYDDENRLCTNADGTAQTKHVEIYFCEDLGEGKAQYWTTSIEEAQSFNSIDQTLKTLLKQHRPEEIAIRAMTTGS
jgi:hypothetical protein